MFIKKRRIVAEEELPETVDTEMEETFEDEDAGEGEVNIDPEISEVLFEAQDVGEILAEVTGEDVDVYSDQDTGDVIINVGDEEYTITPDEDAEEQFVVLLLRSHLLRQIAAWLRRFLDASNLIFLKGIALWVICARRAISI